MNERADFWRAGFVFVLILLGLVLLYLASWPIWQ